MTDPTTPPANRRQFLRIVPDPLEPVRIDIDGVNFFDICKAFDISEGGARIMVPHAFEACDIDHAVDLTLHLPTSRTDKARTKGQIRHISENTFGVKFVGMDEASLDLLRKYIASWIRRNNGLADYVRYKLDPGSQDRGGI